MRVEDVAKYFIHKAAQSGTSLTHLKLQKLTYYAQAWHLAFKGFELFSDAFEAWVHGPVCQVLYREYRCYGFNEIPPLDDNELKSLVQTMNDYPDEKSILDAVWEWYGGYSARHLEAMTHQEEPWLGARAGIKKFARANSEIPKNRMADYYRGLINN